MVKESERLKRLELVHSEVEDTEGWRYNFNNSWSNDDIKSFVLGLFIFGKNFVQIKRFLEKKEMGKILSFYYEKFYKSGGWAHYRNEREKKYKRRQTFFL